MMLTVCGNAGYDILSLSDNQFNKSIICLGVCLRAFMKNHLESRPNYIICGAFFQFASVQNKVVRSLFKKKKKGKNVQLKVLKYNEIYR